MSLITMNMCKYQSLSQTNSEIRFKPNNQMGHIFPCGLSSNKNETVGERNV